MEETPWSRCSKIPNHTTDWKLNPNVKCSIILNKLKVKTPEFETLEFCRMLRNLSVPVESAPPVSTPPESTDMHFKSEFLLDVLLNEILGKCEEKCKVCEEYVQQLRHHINQAHSASPPTQTVFKCDICSSIYSSPSMLIHHRNTHSDNSDTLTTPCTIEPEPVRFDSNNIYPPFDLSSVSLTNESVSSVQCENHPHQPVPVPPMNFEWNCVKQEDFFSSQSELEMRIPNPPGLLEPMNHFSTIENNLKQEYDNLECQEDLRDPLLLQDIDLQQVPAFVKSECTGMSTEFEQQTAFTTHEKSSNDTPAGRESFPVSSDLIRHKMTHTGQKPHKCDVCGKCFGRSHHLTQHKLIHSGRKPHKCGVCGQCFTLNSHLKAHKLTHTGEKPFHCDECGMRFARGSCLASHKLTHTGERPHKCDVCGLCFGYKSVLRRHNLTHTGERPHKCDVCGQGFNRSSQLTQHKLTHTAEKPYKCDVCQRSFRQNSHLTRHNLAHTGERPFCCDVCGRRFTRGSILANHRLTHTGERPHECDVCGKDFAQRSALIRHNLTHTGEKPFGCDVCGRRFAVEAYLATHKMTHTEERPHKCDVCGHGFNQRSHLTTHKLKHHCLSTTNTTPTFVNHLKEERESEEEGCQEDPLLNL